ncbi:MAG TPA: GEVED domain-containing protein [Chitinophagaceae bacterium]|jgi:hypothetical protein|nr:GEVED domain-containing protein [Chitinophagaceae bacterium]
MLKRLISVPILSLLLLSAITGNKAAAQCTNATVNWDNLDYYITTGSYSGYVTAAMAATQRFAIGMNAVTIAYSGTLTNNGESNGNTADAGNDVSYTTGTGGSNTATIILTFDREVTALRFSLYDIDSRQQVSVNSKNGLGLTLNNTTLAKRSGGVLTLSPVSGIGANPMATSSNTTVGSSSNDGTVDVTVAGPVKTITISLSNTGTVSSADIYLGDITACVVGSFPDDYYTISKPYDNQPEWVLAVHDLNTVYMVDPSNGRAVALFTDPNVRVREINNLSYDPYKRIVYYSVDGLERCTPAGNPDSITFIKKYDVTTGVISYLISDINASPYNLPTFEAGLESGGAAFYGSSLYSGVEAYKLTGTKNSGRESVINRIDFAADSLTPVSVCQVFALPVDNGSANIHDWADFVVKDGVIYDFSSSTTLGNGRALHIDMQTNQILTTINPNVSANVMRQTAQTWDGRILWVHNEIGQYNGTTSNTVTNKQTIFNAPRSATWVGPAGDAAEAFRPMTDFGDAPASYDPVSTSPALNEKDSALRIGATLDLEWAKNTSANASGDGADEDGLAFVPILDPSVHAYLAPVSVYNHTGGNAYLSAWLDYNGNGLFDAGEGLAPITVPSGTGMQSFNLYWTGITSPIASGTYTYLRIRITSNNTLTTAKATGYFLDGETEDYRVLVDDFPLSVNVLTFNAKAMNSSTGRLTWTTSDENNLSGFDIERSTDGINWSPIGFVNAKGNGSGVTTDYLYNDVHALKGKSYYRLKLKDQSPSFQYSEIRNITIRDYAAEVSITPNPAKTTATVYINSDVNADAVIVFHDMQGRKLRTTKHRLFTGGNSLVLNNLDQLPDGTYIVQIITGQEIINRKIVIGKSIY